MRWSRQPLRLGALLGPLTIVLSSCIPPAGAAGRTVASPPPAATAMPAPPARPAAAVPAIRIDVAGARQGGVLRGTVSPADARLTLDGEAVAVAPDGGFLIGFDRDAPASAMLRLSVAGRPPVDQPLTVAAGQWQVQNIDAPLRGSATSDADFERRRPGELQQMAAARAMVVTSDGWRQRFIWPVTGRLSGVFGSQRIYRGVPSTYHNGVDVAVPTGTPYVAPADGVVILAAREPFTLEGYLLMIDHGAGLSSVFLHSSRLLVATGDRVVRGQRIGLAGMTGRATGPHLHWAMRWQGRKIDAQLLAGPMPGARP